MTKEEEALVLAEIEGIRADLRRHASEDARREREASPLDPPTFDVSRLELPQIRALIAQRYSDARIKRRLRDLSDRNE